MKTIVKVSDTRQPGLTRAVIRQTGRENLEDIARHGADAGWAGFTTYADTVAFTKRNKAQIMERLKEDADSFGQGLLEMLKGFRCFHGMSESEIADGLYNPKSEQKQDVFNGLAWYAAEEISREMNPNL